MHFIQGKILKPLCVGLQKRFGFFPEFWSSPGRFPFLSHKSLLADGTMRFRQENKGMKDRKTGPRALP